MGNGPPAADASPAAFRLKDCALLSLATGVRAQSLKELRDGLLAVPESSLYHHFWGRLLRPRFDEPEYNNDFATWVHRALHEKGLAERLSMVIPADFRDLEQVRQEVVELVEQRLDESEWNPWARADAQFHFLRARMVIFDTGSSVGSPEELARVLPNLPTGSVYYHFIDARRRTEGHTDDFSAWLAGWGGPCAGLRDELSGFDPYFSSLKEIRRQLVEVFVAHLGQEG
ncbi:MAG: DUF5752 family protein [Deferrisomatales bacterium]|nr:DUF5752 family protein [Deferrisomatales bacterium]